MESFDVRTVAEIDCGGGWYALIAVDGEEVEVSIQLWKKSKVKHSALVTMKRRQLLAALETAGISERKRYV